MLDPLSAGDFPPNPLEKAGYRLEFHDEFDAPVLDTQKWFPYYLPHWSSRERTAPHYRIEDSNLILEIVKDQAAWCPEFDGAVRCSGIQTGAYAGACPEFDGAVRCSGIQTGAYAGAVGSSIGQLQFSKALVVREAQNNVRTYTPQYGYFELRAKGLTTNANHAAWWMIGYEDAPERSGEIAIFELLGAHTSPTESKVNYGVHPWGDATLTDEFYSESFTINTAQYHIYAAEWTPTHIDFYIDNSKIRTINQSPAYPMQFMLTLYEHPFEGAWSGVYNPAAPYPKTFSIDYFRAYQPIDGYLPRS